jgi:hypothetical protein
MYCGRLTSGAKSGRAPDAPETAAEGAPVGVPDLIPPFPTESAGSGGTCKGVLPGIAAGLLGVFLLILTLAFRAWRRGEMNEGFPFLYRLFFERFRGALLWAFRLAAIGLGAAALVLGFQGRGKNEDRASAAIAAGIVGLILVLISVFIRV